MGMFKRLYRLLDRSVAGAFGGGAVGGLAFAVYASSQGGLDWSELPSAMTALALTLFLAAGFGSGFGLIVGIVPTMVLGGAMSPLSRWRPFRNTATWALLGALFGLLIEQCLPAAKIWGNELVWMVGGAAAGGISWRLRERQRGAQKSNLGDLQLRVAKS